MKDKFDTITEMIEAAGFQSPCESEDELLTAILEDKDEDVMKAVGEALTAYAEKRQKLDMH